jgi:hypothetical protein
MVRKKSLSLSGDLATDAKEAVEAIYGDKVEAWIDENSEIGIDDGGFHVNIIGEDMTVGLLTGLDVDEFLGYKDWGPYANLSKNFKRGKDV